jgi:hypothetical protein
MYPVRRKWHLAVVPACRTSKRVSIVTQQTFINWATYYRERAAETRARAEAMADYQARQTMLKAVELWEKMAASAEATSAPRPGDR